MNDSGDMNILYDKAFRKKIMTHPTKEDIKRLMPDIQIDDDTDIIVRVNSPKNLYISIPKPSDDDENMELRLLEKIQAAEQNPSPATAGTSASVTTERPATAGTAATVGSIWCVGTYGSAPASFGSASTASTIGSTSTAGTA